mmetsp:Transcript_34198/g.59084  ORF Transcript_34198/g.59084 Transcript_34198/m.59084 type:complete len:213 (+) Transcript_34198:441-1079(+)
MIQSYIPHPEKAPIDSDPVAKEQKPAPRHHPDLCRAVGDTKVVQIVFVEGGLVVVEDGVPRPEQRPVNAALAGRRPPLPRGVRRGAGEGLLLLLLLLSPPPTVGPFFFLIRFLSPKSIPLQTGSFPFKARAKGPIVFLSFEASISLRMLCPHSCFGNLWNFSFPTSMASNPIPQTANCIKLELNPITLRKYFHMVVPKKNLWKLQVISIGND